MHKFNVYGCNSAEYLLKTKKNAHMLVKLN